MCRESTEQVHLLTGIELGCGEVIATNLYDECE